MSLLRRIENWAVKTCRPRFAPWKRGALLWTGIIVLICSAAASYAQVKYHFANDDIWLVIGVFIFVGMYSVGVAKWGSDLWVSLSMRSPW